MIVLQSLAFGAFKMCVAVFGNQINQEAFEFFFLLFCYLLTSTNNAFDVIPLSLSVLLSNCFLKHQQLPFPSIFSFNQSEHVDRPVVDWRFQQSSALNLGLHGLLGLRLLSFESTTAFETSFRLIGVKRARLPFCQLLVCPFLENVPKGLHWKWVLHHLRNLGMLFLAKFQCIPKEIYGNIQLRIWKWSSWCPNLGQCHLSSWICMATFRLAGVHPASPHLSAWTQTVHFVYPAPSKRTSLLSSSRPPWSNHHGDTSVERIQNSLSAHRWHPTPQPWFPHNSTLASLKQLQSGFLSTPLEALHIFSSSYLLIFTSAHLHICSSSHLLIFTSAPLHIFSSSYLLIFTSAPLHIFLSSHLLIFTSSHLHICSSSHLLIFTSSHTRTHIFTYSHLLSLSLSLSPLSSLLSLSPFSLPFLSLAFWIFLSLGRGWCRRGVTKREPFRTKWGSIVKNWGIKLRFYLCRPCRPCPGATLSHEMRVDRQKQKKNCDFTCPGATLSHEMRVDVQKLR